VKKIYGYRQGIINTKSHPTLLYGQVVYIIEENDSFYIVRVSSTSDIEKIEKNYVLIN
jgi:hypothetical protein